MTPGAEVPADGPERKVSPFTPVGLVEPHARMLKAPALDQKLYKIMSLANFERSLTGQYLHFTRIDKFQGDPGDGAQPPKDRAANVIPKFEKAPDFSASDYYDKARTRTYALCLSQAATRYHWKTYGRGEPAVCVVFDFAKLRNLLNETIQQRGALIYDGIACEQIFSINYGVVEYVDAASHHVNVEHLRAPEAYAFIKDKRFAPDQEVRITLSAFGLGDFALNDGSYLPFRDYLQLGFSFHHAIKTGIIHGLLTPPEADEGPLRDVLERVRIKPAESASPG